MITSPAGDTVSCSHCVARWAKRWIVPLTAALRRPSKVVGASVCRNRRLHASDLHQPFRKFAAGGRLLYFIRKRQKRRDAEDAAFLSEHLLCVLRVSAFQEDRAIQKSPERNE